MDSLTVSTVSSPAHGFLSMSSSGAFTFTPNVGYAGTDSFTFKANDGAADSNTATYTLTVSTVTGAPTASGDSYTAADDHLDTSAESKPSVLANDAVVNNDPLTAVLVSNPLHGSVTLNSNGHFTYTPTLGYTGSDFPWRVVWLKVMPMAVSFSQRARSGRSAGALQTQYTRVSSRPCPRS